MESYVQEVGFKPFNWTKFLSKERGRTAWRTAMNKASDWVTCACGNQCAIIPRHSNGRPKDPTLSDLGLRFTGAISCQEIEKAKCLLQEIEVRSAELIHEINSNSNDLR